MSHSPYQLQEDDEYRLVRGVSAQADTLNLETGVITPSKESAVAPCEEVSPCHERGKDKWICVEPDGTKCPRFRGFNPQTKMIACAINTLNEQPLDLKRLTVFYTLLNSVNHDLCRTVTSWRAETINALCSGELNVSIRVNVEFEPMVKK